MSEVRKEKVTFGDLKKAKSEFDKELNRVKICINTNKIGEAKSGIDKCDSHITKMENIIDRMPDKTAADIVKKLVPTVLAIEAIKVFCTETPRRLSSLPSVLRISTCLMNCPRGL